MAVEARIFGQSCLDVRFLWRPLIVNDQVQVHLWKLPVYQTQNLQPLLVSVTGLTLLNHFAVQNIQCGKEGGRTMPDIVMCVGARTPLLEGKSGLGPVQSLNLASFHPDKARWLSAAGLSTTQRRWSVWPQSSDHATTRTFDANVA